MEFQKDKYFKSVSLIIGCIFSDHKYVKKLITNIGDNQFFLKEILIIFNDVKNENNKNLINSFSYENANIIKFIYKDKLLPGDARNKALSKCTSEFIAFLDASTMPENLWLEKSFKLMIEKNINGVLGNTQFIFKNSFEKSFMASTYGPNSLKTVPGSLFKKSFIDKIGYFLPHLRSGEDKEWINRAIKLDETINVKNYGKIYYLGLVGKKFVTLCRKWFIYYSNNAQDYSIEIERQRFIYITYFCILVFLVSYFWNDTIAEWDESSKFYLSHVTKISFFSLLMIYFFIRNLIIPKRKNIKLKDYNLLEIIYVIFISLVIDIIKLFAFIKSFLKFKI